MLPGVSIRNTKMNFDERGWFSELMRVDWEESEQDLAQASLSFSYPNTIRAWHRHLRGQIDYLTILEGAKVCIYDEDSSELDEIVLTSYNRQLLKIPGTYWHGFKVIGNTPAWLLYFENRLYDYESPDEERRPWNDQNIVPRIINGRTDDPRVGRPWDWTLPPHR